MEKKRPVTKEECIQGHRDMWNWIADTSMQIRKRVYPYDYFKRQGIKNRPSGNNFICEYNNNAFRSKRCKRCKDCIIQWEDYDGNKTKICVGSIYSMFFHQIGAYDYKKAAEIARRIANLPSK